MQRRTRPLALLRPLLRALCVSLLVVRGEAMSWAPRLHATRWVHHRMPTTPQKRINRKLLMTTDDRAADYSYDVATLDAPPMHTKAMRRALRFRRREGSDRSCRGCLHLSVRRRRPWWISPSPLHHQFQRGWTQSRYVETWLYAAAVHLPSPHTTSCGDARSQALRSAASLGRVQATQAGRR